MTRLAQWPHLTRLSDLVHGVVRIVPVFIGRAWSVVSHYQLHQWMRSTRNLPLITTQLGTIRHLIQRRAQCTISMYIPAWD